MRYGRALKRPLAGVAAIGTIAAVGLATTATASAQSSKPAAKAVAGPSAPAKLKVVDSRAGLYLTWTQVAGTGYTIAQGTDRALHKNRRDYQVRGRNNQFTPYGLAVGKTYYFRIRTNDGSRTSHFGPEVAATAHKRAQAVRVMTYNILELTADGTVASGGQRVAPWNTKRKAVAAALIKRGNADVIGVQEAWPWTGQAKGPRQIDSLKAALGPGYSLAHTEIAPNEPHYFRTGDYIIYRNSAYRAIGAGGHWLLGGAKYAAYQVLQNRASGAKFLFVATHAGVGQGRSYDKVREAQTQKMLQQAGTYAAHAGGLPVIYVGDFNSYLGRLHPYDGPGRAMRAAHVADGLLVAQALTNAKYNSANQYLRTPPAFGCSIDHVFASPGVAVGGWSELLNLSRGRLVGVIPSDHNPVVASVSYPY